MATRFGAVSPAHRYATKVRWLVACLVSVILVLLVTVVIIAQHQSAPSDGGPAPAAAATPTPSPSLSPTRDLLVALTRIEEGAELRDHMFGTLKWPTDSLPEGVLFAEDMPKIRGKFAKSVINVNMPIIEENDITGVRPVSSLNIPKGFRAVTIEVDARTGVEGFAKPNTRVDILWTTTDAQGQRQVATIVRFTKVLSVGGLTQTEQPRAQVAGATTTVTLLVSEKDAKKIELARTLGSLSLVLVGDVEEGVTDSDDPGTITKESLLPRVGGGDDQQPPADGTVYMTDPVTGCQRRYELRKGKWVMDKSFGC